MQIMFDPNNESDVAAVTKILFAENPEVVGTTTVVNNAVVQGGGETISGATTGNITESPENREDPANPEIPELDSLGMAHNEAYHQTPPALNKDGTFKAKRGQGEAHKAAVAAHKAGGAAPATEAPAMPSEAPAPAAEAAAMPGMPGAPTQVEVPPRVIGFEEMAERFTGLMASGKITDFNPIYQEAGVPTKADGTFDGGALQTDETLRRAIWDIMDRIEA